VEKKNDQLVVSQEQSFLLGMKRFLKMILKFYKAEYEARV
jgi:hypothetical protein